MLHFQRVGYGFVEVLEYHVACGTDRDIIDEAVGNEVWCLVGMCRDAVVLIPILCCNNMVDRRIDVA